VNMPAEDGTRSPRRRWLVTSAIAGIAVAALGAGTAVALQPPAQLAATPGPTTSGTSSNDCIRLPADTPSDGLASDPASPGATSGERAGRPERGGLDVIEFGFAQIGSAAAPITRDGFASLGAIVANTSDQIAYQAQVTFRVLDDAGRSAVLHSTNDPARQIPVILPGQRVGVGTRYAVRSESGKRIRIASVDVEITGSAWGAADASPTGAGLTGAVTARHLDTWRYGPDGLDASVTYEVDSPYCSALASAGAGVVFRDATGGIVGGGFDPTASRHGCLPGRSTQSALLPRSLPPDADAERTEVYQYCGPRPAPDQTLGTGSGPTAGADSP
jgi:hypothetical protein